MESVAGAVTLVVTVLAAAAVGRESQRRWWGPLHGPEATLATTVLAVGALVLLGQLLGAVGLFRPVPVLMALVVAGAAIRLAPGGLQGGAPPTEVDLTATGPRDRRLGWSVVAGLGALVAAQWTSAAFHTLRNGVFEADSLHYHLPRAARFAQTGEVFTVFHVGTAHPAAYYPANDELLRAYAMLSSRSELPGIALNLAAAALLLLAAWVVGRRCGRGPSALAVSLVLLASPAYGAGYAGWAHNDWTAIALVAAGAALLGSRLPARPRAVLVGLALGLAAGTKVSVLPAVLALALAVIVLAPRAERPVAASAVVGSAALLGGGWYLRNLIVLGTPLPGTPWGPTALIPDDAYTVASYLDDPGVMADWFVPGLDAVVGPLWLVVLVAAIVGPVLAIRRGGWWRAVGATALVALGAYLVTPTGAVGPPGRPVLFAANLRYAWPGLLLGLWCLAVVVPDAAADRPDDRGGWRVPPDRLLVLASAVVLGVGLASRTAFAGASPGWSAGAWVLAVGTGVGVWFAHDLPPRGYLPRLGALAAGTLGLVGVALLAGPLVPGYETRRYGPPAVRSEAQRVLFEAAQQLDGAHVAVAGWPMNYPSFGPQLRNEVSHLGVFDAEGAYVDPADCATFRATLSEGGYDHLALFTRPGQPGRPPQEAWVADRERITVLAATDGGSLIRLDAPLPATGCPDEAPA